MDLIEYGRIWFEFVAKESSKCKNLSDTLSRNQS